ncbi:class I SAM-dependent methyltransferase [Ramlibacter sp. Leaf400]|uniref:class I SAM-dependent methyltransferase n=1 Tax=Ramlibacter sp. Leaf400 TaxID=1736365 RepID=UPI0006FE7DB1|nr:class I SAM-dependent methyltransferase [Ramlibacter sp. Leaf400]KQT10156.1 methyltransferase type 11 [Ramlibacter sp. Leaf400]
MQQQLLSLRRRQLCLAAAACVGPHAFAQPAASGYETVPRSADGIGKAFMGREIAGVMGWQGAAWLEREERERQERSDLLLRELRLAPGMQVADVGAGTGYHARRIARLVAPGGTVQAVDVQPQMLEQLQARARREGVDNIVPVLASERDARLAPASLDLALLVDVYHELEYPVEVMAGVVRALRPGGRVVLVEYRAEDPAVPIKSLHKMSEAQIRREMAVHPLVHERTANVLPWQHIVVFVRRD